MYMSSLKSILLQWVWCPLSLPSQLEMNDEKNGQQLFEYHLIILITNIRNIKRLKNQDKTQVIWCYLRVIWICFGRIFSSTFALFYCDAIFSFFSTTFQKRMQLLQKPDEWILLQIHLFLLPRILTNVTATTIRKNYLQGE